MTEEKARKTCCNDQLHVKASCGFFHKNNSNFESLSNPTVCVPENYLPVLVLLLAIVGVDGTERQIV